MQSKPQQFLASNPSLDQLTSKTLDPFIPSTPIPFESLSLTFTVPYQNGVIKVYRQNYVPEQDMLKLQKCTKFNQFIDQIRKSGNTTFIDGILVRCIMIFGRYKFQPEQKLKNEKHQKSIKEQKVKQGVKQEQDTTENKQLEKDNKFQLEKKQKGDKNESVENKNNQKKEGRIGYVVLKIQGNWSWRHRHYENYIFLQGRSVAILLFINDKILVVQQYRVPKHLICIQPPAGMMDEQKNLNSQAIKQLGQETGLEVTGDILIELGSVRPNPRISDQELFLYFGKIKLSEEQMKAAQKKIYGQPDSGQRIKIKFIDYDQKMIRETGNCSFIMLAAFYQNYLKKQSQSQ